MFASIVHNYRPQPEPKKRKAPEQYATCDVRIGDEDDVEVRVYGEVDEDEEPSGRRIQFGIANRVERCDTGEDVTDKLARRENEKCEEAVLEAFGSDPSDDSDRAYDAWKDRDPEADRLNDCDCDDDF